MDSEVIIICTTGLTGKPTVFEPKSGVCLPRVLRDIGRWSVPWWESSIEDVLAKGLRAWQARPWTLVLAAVVASATPRMIAAMSSFPWVTVGASAGVEGAAYVAVAAEALMQRDRSALPAALWCLVDQCVPGKAHRGRALAGVELASLRQRAFHLLRRRTLKQHANLAILGHCCL